MVFKHRSKTFISMGLIYGIILGLYFGFSTNNPILGIVIGIFTGALYGLLLFWFLHSVEKNIKPIRLEISKEHTIICDGIASYKNKNGWLFFTDDGIEFYPRKIKNIRYMLCLPNTQLKSTMLQNNYLVVSTIDNKEYMFAVVNNAEWKNQIDGYFRKCSENP